MIETAAQFERLKLYAVDFLKDLEESVCILLLDGLTYTFTHRSFQEYFSALFISRGPPLELGMLLDDLASRRGDVVIPMAFEMNRNLLEKEWVLPRLRELVSTESPLKPFAFLRKIAGGISYDGGGGKFGAIALKREGGGRDVDVLLALSQLYQCFRRVTRIPLHLT